MKIFTFQDPSRWITKVAFVTGENSAIKTAFNFTNGRSYTIQPGENLPKECLIEIPNNVLEEMIKAFAEMANEKGMKLDADLKREGQLEATKYHLEDLRKLLKLQVNP